MTDYLETLDPLLEEFSESILSTDLASLIELLVLTIHESAVIEGDTLALALSKAKIRVLKREINKKFMGLSSDKNSNPRRPIQSLGSFI